MKNRKLHKRKFKSAKSRLNGFGFSNFVIDPRKESVYSERNGKLENKNFEVAVCNN